MSVQYIHTDNAPQAIGPYSQAVKANGFLYISGQIPVDPATGSVVEASYSIQTKQSMANLAAILKEADLTFADVVKTTIFLTDMAHFPEVNEAYAAFFEGPCPARACVEVSRLPKDVLVEIALVAASLHTLILKSLSMVSMLRLFSPLDIGRDSEYAVRDN